MYPSPENRKHMTYSQRYKLGWRFNLVSVLSWLHHCCSFLIRTKCLASIFSLFINCFLIFDCYVFSNPLTLFLSVSFFLPSLFQFHLTISSLSGLLLCIFKQLIDRCLFSFLSFSFQCFPSVSHLLKCSYVCLNSRANILEVNIKFCLPSSYYKTAFDFCNCFLVCI